MHPGLHGENLNIGTGVKTAVGDLVELTREAFHLEVEPRFDTIARQAWDRPDWYADPSKALREIGWSERTVLKDGLVSMSKWVVTLSDRQMAEATKKGSGRRRRSVSAVIACYKDGQAIPVMYKRLSETFRQLDVDYEIIFVNDGSPDNSAEVIREIKAREIHTSSGSLIRETIGSQMAFRSGMELANDGGVALLDGDLQDPPELISEGFTTNWEQGLRRRVRQAGQAGGCLGTVAWSTRCSIGLFAPLQLREHPARRRRLLADGPPRGQMVAQLPQARSVPARVARLRRFQANRR